MNADLICGSFWGVLDLGDILLILLSLQKAGGQALQKDGGQALQKDGGQASIKYPILINQLNQSDRRVANFRTHFSFMPIYLGLSIIPYPGFLSSVPPNIRRQIHSIHFLPISAQSRFG